MPQGKLKKVWSLKIWEQSSKLKKGMRKGDGTI